jgi:transposase
MYSLDLKTKILNSYLEGNYSQEKISEIFGVSRTFLTDVLKKYRDKGNVEADTFKCGRKSVLGPKEKEYLKSSVEKDKSITLLDLSLNLKLELNVKASTTTIHNYLKSINMNYKKNSLRSKKGH